MLVTIGIPAYKRVDSFERALRSALAQSHTDLEILISKDYSDSKAVDEITNRYAAADPRIRFISQSVSLRTVGNFSFVKNEAKGKYFLWVADDDWIDADYVEKCVAFLENNPSYSLACGLCSYEEMDGTVIHTYSSFSVEQNSYWRRIFTYFRRVTLNGYFYGVLRTAIAKEFTLPDQLAFDWSLVAYFCFKGKLKMLPATSSHISKGGMSNEGSGLTGYFARKRTLLKNYIGLSSSLNCAGNVFYKGLYPISWFKKTGLAFLIFLASYSNTISWDLLYIKRRLVKLLKISPDGVVRNK